MNSMIEEEEIKIEYFESVEEDPLSENCLKLSSGDCLSNICNESNVLNENGLLDVSYDTNILNLYILSYFSAINLRMYFLCIIIHTERVWSKINT